jgi:hypothetical protein
MKILDRNNANSEIQNIAERLWAEMFAGGHVWERKLGDFFHGLLYFTFLHISLYLGLPYSKVDF